MKSNKATFNVRFIVNLRVFILGSVIGGVMALSQSCCAYTYGFDMTRLQRLVDHAQGGDVITIPPGIYYGNLKINKSITLNGKGRVILDGKQRGSVIKVNAPNVRLISLKIRNSGIELGNEDSAILLDDSPQFLLKNTIITNTLFGIQLRASPHSKIINVKIKGYPFDLARRGDVLKAWYSPHLEVANGDFSGGRDVVVWYSDYSKMINNTIRNGRYGVHYMYSHKAQVKNNTIEDNSVGIYMMYSHNMILEENNIHRNHGPSGFGIALKECNEIKIIRNSLIGNRVGIHSDNSPLKKPKQIKEESLVMSNNISHNDIGFNFVGRGKGLTIVKNDFNDNWVQVSSKAVRELNSKWEENYWSDYKGIDIEGRGIGAFPYRARNLFNDLTDKYEGLKVFSFGPAIIALNFTERLLPWLNESPKFEDKRPRMGRWKNYEKRSINYAFIFIFLGMSFCVSFLWRLGRI